MEWNEDIDLSKRGISAQMMVRQAMARGWKVCGFETNTSIFLLYIPGRTEPVQIFSSSPPFTSFVGSKIAKDKVITNALLGAAGLPVPAEMLLHAKDYDRQAAEKFIMCYEKTVLKPLDGAHGKGITMGVSSMVELDKAIANARNYSTRIRMVLQEQLEGIDIRVVCMDYKYVNAMTRTPAAVTGDGEHSVRELIDIVNSRDDRGFNYSASLNMIQLDRVVEYLGEDALSSVPEAGRAVQVIGVANIGMGGIRKNVRDDVSAELRAMAEKVSRVLQLPLCGVDFIVKKSPAINDDVASLDPRIIEVNTCPTLTVYEDLKSSEQVEVIDKYLDYVAGY